MEDALYVVFSFARSDEITSVSFNIVSFSAFFDVNFVFVFQIPRILNTETGHRLGGWREHLKGILRNARCSSFSRIRPTL